jgi:hypothetical protein
VNKEPEKDTIDLSFLLNLLDGTLEANGLNSDHHDQLPRAY